MKSFPYLSEKNLKLAALWNFKAKPMLESYFSRNGKLG
jgi:hypothetical protein